MRAASQETIDHVEEIVNQGLQILVIEEGSAEELQSVLNELGRQGYARVVGFSTAVVHSYVGSDCRYTAVVQKTGPTVQERKILPRLGQ